MPQPIYMPRQPTFMDQFLSTGIMENIMRGIQMRNQNQRADQTKAQGLQEQGYSEVQPVPKSQQGAAPQNAAEQAAFQSGPRGQYWQQHQPADVSVGGGRGPFSTPQRGFKEPKMSYKVVRDAKTKKSFLELYKGSRLQNVSPMTETQAKIQRKKRIVIKKDPATGTEQAYAQEYNYDSSSGQSLPYGDPYRTKVGGDTNIDIKMSSASEREKLARGGAAMDNLDNMKSLFGKAFVGPISGRMGKAKDVFGLNKQGQSEFYAATSAFTNEIIKEITGAQMSEPEAKRIMKQVPNVNDPPTVWMAKWRQSKRNVVVLRKKRLEVMRKSGVRTPDISTPKTQSTKKADPFGFNDQF